jgi:hypothetical protein
LLIKFQTSKIFIFLKILNETKNILTLSRLSDPIYYSPISGPPPSTYNSQHNNNNNNVVLAMAMPYSGQGRRHSALQVVHYVFNPDHYIGIVIAINTTLL